MGGSSTKPTLPSADGPRQVVLPSIGGMPSRGTDRQAGAAAYENRLGLDRRWALSEGSRHFEQRSAVFEALRKITRRLDELGVSYAVVGALAMFHHGLRRFTEDVGILVTKKDLRKIHENLEGLGYVPPHRHSKHLRDTELGVRIEFLTTGDYPGDGKKKPVAFPEPGPVAVEFDGVKYVDLPTLVELKLASGMTNPNRMKDLSDVMELVKLLELPAGFAEQLSPYVREKYLELRGQAKKRYVTLWRNKWLTSQAKTTDEMIASLRAAADTLEAMQRDGVVLEDDGGTADDYANLVTTDPEVARKYDMVEESEFWGDDDQEDSDEGSD